jgi:glycosyltransferase involved in cell wall biosynthesis
VVAQSSDGGGRSVVIVSPHFPPSTVAGVHRARHLAKHLPRAGWNPIILCVDEAFQTERLDPDLAQLVPPTTEIVKTGAAPARIARGFGVGDLGLRAWPHLRAALERLAARGDVKAVMITGFPFYPMVLAPAIRRRFGLPVVLDFQDPWVSAWGAAQAPFSKAGLAHRLARRLEPRALRGAAFVTSVSQVQNAEIAARYAWLDADRMAAIPIGGDPDDFAALAEGRAASPRIELAPGLIHLCYVGTFLPRAAPVMRTLMRAFARLRAETPALAARLRLRFVGTSNQLTDGARPTVLPIAAEEGVADAVCEEPARIPFLSALDLLTRADGVLLIGSDEPHYTASKIYPALMCGRPHLSVFHAASSAHAILSAAGGGCAFAFETPGDLPGLEAPIARGLGRLAAGADRIAPPDPDSYADYLAEAVARRFGAVFDRVAAESPRRV